MQLSKQTGSIKYPCFKLYYEAIVIKEVQYWDKIRLIDK